MRALTFIMLVVLSAASVASGRIELALVFAGAKATLLGLSFMELKDAARVHALAYVGFVAALTAVLAMVV